MSQFCGSGDGAVTVSVVVAALNAREQLAELLRSVAEEGGRGFEMVVVDGGSVDGTVEWLQSCAAESQGVRLVWRSAPDQGIADAWNRGTALARGDWILFLGADDRFAPASGMSAVLGRLRSLPPSVLFAAFPVHVVSPSGRSVGTVVPKAGGPREFPVVNSLPHQGVFHRKHAWRKHGPFDVTLHVASDYEFLVRSWANGDRPMVIDGMAPPVRMAFGGVSKRSPLANLREYRLVRRRYGVGEPALHAVAEWCRAAARAVMLRVCGRRMVDRLADTVRKSRGLPPVWSIR